jgi:hypothetical protein
MTTTTIPHTPTWLLLHLVAPHQIAITSSSKGGRAGITPAITMEVAVIASILKTLMLTQLVILPTMAWQTKGTKACHHQMQITKRRTATTLLALTTATAWLHRAAFQSHNSHK